MVDPADRTRTEFSIAQKQMMGFVKDKGQIRFLGVNKIILKYDMAF
jgi:hypothetical protein